MLMKTIKMKLKKLKIILINKIIAIGEIGIDLYRKKKL